VFFVESIHSWLLQHYPRQHLVYLCSSVAKESVAAPVNGFNEKSHKLKLIMTGVAYNVVAIVIFVFVSLNFLFPCNFLIPLGKQNDSHSSPCSANFYLFSIFDHKLDRRTTSVLGALLCYLTRRFAFPSEHMDVLNAVDFDVMILLSSIMIINHIVVHLKETKDVIEYLQCLVQRNPTKGFWVISFAAFLASPFLTNDGVCLLFVEPILNAFENAPLAIDSLVSTTNKDHGSSGRLSLQKEDAIYFLLALACSANIGSALTYTGNPQNMIVASDSIGVLPPYKFLLYMLPATVFSWLLSKFLFR
jgi:di/tricarboxylate transporter